MYEYINSNWYRSKHPYKYEASYRLAKHKQGWVALVDRTGRYAELVQERDLHIYFRKIITCLIFEKIREYFRNRRWRKLEQKGCLFKEGSHNE